MQEVKETIAKKYKVVSQIGKGGMSSVYLAEDKDGKDYAVKAIDKTSKAYLAAKNPDGTLDEVEIVRFLNHPDIPHVYDVYETQEKLYIVMDYVKGISLSEYIRKNGPIPYPEAMKYMIQICNIFLYLHTRECPVIYRDLKPSNLIMQEDNLKLLDFGIAVELSGSRCTKKVKALGTKGYASPEHFKGMVDERSDIYTLGTTFYSMITGKNPRIKGAPFPAGEDFPKDIDPVARHVIMKACERESKDRYQSVAELMQDCMKPPKVKKKKTESRKVFLQIGAGFILAMCLALWMLLRK